MRLADKLLLCAASIYTVLQCARVFDVFHAWFFMEYFFSVFSFCWPPSSIAGCFALTLKRKKDKEIKSEMKGEKL